MVACTVVTVEVPLPNLATSASRIGRSEVLPLGMLVTYEVSFETVLDGVERIDEATDGIVSLMEWKLLDVKLSPGAVVATSGMLVSILPPPKVDIRLRSSRKSAFGRNFIFFMVRSSRMFSE